MQRHPKKHHPRNRQRNLPVLLWDILVWILFVFPWVTGGVWIKQPGLKLELSEVGIPVLVLAVLASGLKWIGNAPLEQASSVRFLMLCWNRWQEILFRSPKKTLWLAASGIGLVEAFASFRRHWAMGSGAADLGIFTNAIWNLTHGNGYISSVKDGMNLFSDHQSPIFWLIAPLFYLFPKVELLLLIQALALASGGVIVYYLGKQYLSTRHWGLAALPLLYWAYLPLRNANAFDFHPEVLILPLLLSAILGLQSERTRGRILGALSLILGLGGKESAPLVVAGIGAAWILGAGPLNTRSFTRKIGPLLIGLGGGAFYFDTQIVPKLLGGKYVYQASYKHFGSGLTDIILSPIYRPQVFFTQILGVARLKFLFWTLAPLAFLPLLNPKALLAAAPGYLILFLAEGTHRVSPIYHYAVEPSVGLFWAMPLAIDRFQKLRFIKMPSTQLAKTVWILFWSLGTFGRSELYRIRVFEPSEHDQWLKQEFLPKLTQKSMSVPGALVPQLATRPWIHHLPVFEMPHQNLVDCVILDPKVNNWPLDTQSTNSLPQKLASLNYQLEYSCGTVQVYKKKELGDSCFIQIPKCPS